jgi:palmitoyl-protein thioesterase
MLYMPILVLVIAAVLSIVAADDAIITDRINSLRKYAETRPDDFAEELQSSPFAAVLNRVVNRNGKRSAASDSTTLPLVFLHGMGDSCFNRGMDSLTKESGEYLGVYSVCIPTGSSRIEDTLNGFFMSMDESVDVFAAKVRSDPKLAGGFNCVGLSQGNNICRGYIQKYNSPQVNTHLSVHGPIVGVSSLPSCLPDSPKVGTICQSVDDLLGKFAYNTKVQDFLFQAGYFREINFVNSLTYKKYSEMAQWNNEGITKDPTINTNFAKTNKFAMIKANGDTVVVPREGEWFGQYSADFTTVLTMKETDWYKSDLFGLRTADEAGKIYFNSTEGNHLDFTDEQMFGWLDIYCK